MSEPRSAAELLRLAMDKCLACDRSGLWWEIDGDNATPLPDREQFKASDLRSARLIRADLRVPPWITLSWSLSLQVFRPTAIGEQELARTERGEA